MPEARFWTLEVKRSLEPQCLILNETGSNELTFLSSDITVIIRGKHQQAKHLLILHF